jgi:secondary thiamine-phosphate synthase enzyme
MKTANTILSHQTKSLFDFIDITAEVEKFVSESSIKNGLVNVQILHTSAALIFNENEPLLLQDIKANLEKIAPKNASYQHDEFDKRTVNVCENECVNGHSHCKAIRLPSNITLNLIEGKLQLGQWQRIMLVELDSSRPRKIQVQVIGE